MEEPKFTKGPWFWKVNPKYKSVELVSSYKGDSIFCLRRWGTNGAMIQFTEDGLFHPIKKFMAIIKGREHHAEWAQTINHPDAHLIASAPDLFAYAVAEEKFSNHLIDCPYPYSRGCLICEVMAQKTQTLRASALSKARGEQP